MGVRGLQSFLENYCPNACYPVDIALITDVYRRRTGRNATIVIDADSCYNMWYAGIDWSCGFAIQEFVHRLQMFVESFKKLEIELVFFFGGGTVEKKRNTWIMRRKRDIERNHQVLNELMEGRANRQDVVNHYESILPNMDLIVSYILKYILNCKTYASIDECDEEIIEYAHEHDCYAIFGQDTDFVVSQVNAVVLSSNHFNLEKMTTVLYDRVKLASHLNIRVDELPLLSILAGNDYIQFTELTEFHRRLCRVNPRYRGHKIPFETLMPAIGQYINRLPKNARLEFMAHDLFNNSSHMERLQASHNSYFGGRTKANVTGEDKWSVILDQAKDRHKNILVPSILYPILSERIFESTVILEDLESTNDGNSLTRDQPSETVIRPLRLRLYGVLFFEKSKEKSLTVREWCGENVNSYSKPVEVEPIYPSVEHPGLLLLWSHDKTNDRLNDIRWELFVTSVCPTLKVRQWQTLDDDLLLLTLSVHYLYNVKYLNESEVRAVLATIATYPLYNLQRLHSLPSVDWHHRVLSISVLLIRTYGILLSLLATCGYPIPLSSSNALPKFEGKVFEKKFSDMTIQEQDDSSLCDHDAKSLEVFSRMKTLILGDANGAIRGTGEMHA